VDHARGPERSLPGPPERLDLMFPSAIKGSFDKLFFSPPLLIISFAVLFEQFRESGCFVSPFDSPRSKKQFRMDAFWLDPRRLSFSPREGRLIPFGSCFFIMTNPLNYIETVFLDVWGGPNVFIEGPHMRGLFPKLIFPVRVRATVPLLLNYARELLFQLSAVAFPAGGSRNGSVFFPCSFLLNPLFSCELALFPPKVVPGSWMTLY